MAFQSFKEMFAEAKSKDGYWVELAKLDFVRGLSRLMNLRGIRKKHIADNIGFSPAYMTKVMRGDENLTIESMVKLCRAAGGQFHIHVAEENNAVRWFEHSHVSFKETVKSLRENRLVIDSAHKASAKSADRVEFEESCKYVAA